MIRVLLFLTFFVISSAANATAESFFTSDAYLEGKVAFDAGNYESAVNIWIKSAEKGYPEAQGFIGGMYHAGLGVEKNYKKELRNKLYLLNIKGIDRTISFKSLFNNILFPFRFVLFWNNRSRYTRIIIA